MESQQDRQRLKDRQQSPNPSLDISSSPTIIETRSSEHNDSLPNDENGSEKREVLTREICRYRVWMRDHRCCRRCGVPVKLKSDTLFDLMHAHEIVLRSKGGDPNDTRNVISLCLNCHLNGAHRQTSKQSAWFVVVVLNLQRGADDPAGIAFEPFVTKEARWHASSG